jgi:hypothetical protein
VILHGLRGLRALTTASRVKLSDPFDVSTVLTSQDNTFRHFADFIHRSGLLSFSLLSMVCSFERIRNVRHGIAGTSSKGRTIARCLRHVDMSSMHATNPRHLSTVGRDGKHCPVAFRA